jgi:uncharacterized protein DUF4440
MTTTVLLAGLLLGASPTPVPAQPPPSRRIPTVTRLVQLFSGLENDWLEAVKRGDEAAVTGLLGESFEMRSALAPGAPVPGAEWVQSALHEFRLMSFTLSGMAVRDMGTAAVVSFRLEQVADAAGKHEWAAFFVTDVWVQADGAWKVEARYVDAPAGHRVVGTPTSRPNIPKKY